MVLGLFGSVVWAIVFDSRDLQFKTRIDQILIYFIANYNKKYLNGCSGNGSDGTAVVSDSRDPWFKTQYQQKFFIVKNVSIAKKRWKEIETGKGSNLKKYFKLRQSRIQTQGSPPESRKANCRD